ncbi:tumor necrosis factor receptor superfamily member 6 isoform X2 [Periophthalmus magnuspinnatus]|uniref:tumor necrosis factor receptor superfamily member 6 isoform X2 n=1 Tax=Periophthalmus magnuspinnatus TaxID=409849 RepID=UPI002436FCA2|nr:tumor necrosis factor receptor superfamily member 6 isoform X2 [Periophthalmus magnuspinnatus]
MAFLFVVLALCMLASQTEGRVRRLRRQSCLNGTYEYMGLTCCKCAAGSKVEEHCTSQTQTRCEPCEPGKQYQSHANELKTCESCTSCGHPSANLEVDRQCTPLVDSTCKCKENHYCSSGTTPCKICEPCQLCDSEGIKVACSATNNTICNDKSKEHKNIQNDREDTRGPEENMSLLERLGPHIPEIAEVITWKNMRNLAMKSGIHASKIESCEQDHQNSSTERTIALMRIWEEKESWAASEKLVQFLKQTYQNSKAEEVLTILRGGNS